MNKSFLFLAIAIIFVYFDISISVFALGFYLTSHNFDGDLIIKYLTFKDGYSFLTSHMDFVFLSIFQTIVLIFGILFFLKNEATAYKLKLFFVGIQFFNLTFTFTKILAFAEFPEQLKFFGFWASIIWNFAAFLLIFPIWFGIFHSRHKFQSPLSFLDGENTSNNEGYEELLESSDDSEISDATPPPIKVDRRRPSTMKQLKYLLSYCLRHGRWFIATFVFFSAYTLIGIYQPYYVSQVVTNILNAKGMSIIIYSIFQLFALYIISSIFGGILVGCLSYSMALINKTMQSDFFKSIVFQEIAFFDEIKTGEIISRLTMDYNHVSHTFSLTINVLFLFVRCIGYLIFMLKISWQLTFITFISMPLIAFVTQIFGIFFGRISESMQTKTAEANSYAEQVIGSIRTVRSFACELKEFCKFEEKLNQTFKIAAKSSMASSGYTGFNDLSSYIVQALIFLYGGHLVMAEKMETHNFQTFFLYERELRGQAMAIGNVFTWIMEIIGGTRKIFEFTKREPKIKYNGIKMPEKIEGKIEFKNVSFSYPRRASTTILDDVSFCINPNETIAIVGPNGAGKSSIISLLERFYEAQNGEITLDGIDIKDFNHEYFHQKVAIVSQEPILYSGSIRDNILYGCEGFKTDADMIEAAKLANIHDLIMETENGYETQCGEKGVQLSGGQKQRIAIARALVREPAVLILDEATSALDAESQRIIQETIQKCAIGRTVIIVTHNLSTIENVDRIIVIQKGKIVQIGNHQTLMHDTQGLYYSLIHP